MLLRRTARTPPSRIRLAGTGCSAMVDVMEHSDVVGKYLSGPGVEIGAFKTPIPGIKPIYLDRFASYANEPTLADYYGDTCEIPFHDSSLQYVASSHVLEHTANPYRALVEWFRVLRHGGIIYMVVPDRRFTFDRKRELTSVEHMLQDFRAGVTQTDGTHVTEYVENLDWSLFSPQTPPDGVSAAREALLTPYRNAVAAGLEINIHFHTFEPSNVRAMFEEGNRHAVWDGRIEILQQEERFPASNPIGILIVAQVHKPLKARLSQWFGKKGLRNPRRFDR